MITMGIGLTDHSTHFRRCSTRPDGPNEGQKFADIVDQISVTAHEHRLSLYR
jgi:hypothetical protein